MCVGRRSSRLVGFQLLEEKRAWEEAEISREGSSILTWLGIRWDRQNCWKCQCAVREARVILMGTGKWKGNPFVQGFCFQMKKGKHRVEICAKELN